MARPGAGADRGRTSGPLRPSWRLGADAVDISSCVVIGPEEGVLAEDGGRKRHTEEETAEQAE